MEAVDKEGRSSREGEGKPQEHGEEEWEKEMMRK
jgi:hypothetical protein